MAVEQNPIFNKTVDQILEQLPIGSVKRAISNNLYGFNFKQTGNIIPRAKDGRGYVFFTRPQLNLSTVNASNASSMYSLLTDNANSYQRYTRMTLDPRLALESRLSCPFVDNANIFIPSLTNNVKSLSGWPDLTVPTYTSDTGLYGQELSFVDGVTNNYEAFDIDATFLNSRGNPLLYMFYIWIKYSALVFEGVLDPYLDMIFENEIDYNTRIYRVVMDDQNRFVRYMACTGASFPINVPTGMLLDFNADLPLNTANQEFPIRFRSNGFVVFDDIVKYWFNKAQAIANPEIRKIFQHDMSARLSDKVLREDGASAYMVEGSSYVKIPHFLREELDGQFGAGGYALNHRAYPYINLRTSELEWWVDAKRYNKDYASLIDSYDD